ncbi:hypothetical protein [Streptomyces sp. NPDC018045]|uniref:hypothetical protein n=1 Tax=Streptomyces sp. NPDC018045 TaxID=3365037 RepID=UPI0037BD0BB2
MGFATLRDGTPCVYPAMRAAPKARQGCAVSRAENRPGVRVRLDAARDTFRRCGGAVLGAELIERFR